MDMVSTAVRDEVCPLFPTPLESDKPRLNFTHFDIKDKLPWTDKPHKEMLVSMRGWGVGRGMVELPGYTSAS